MPKENRKSKSGVRKQSQTLNEAGADSTTKQKIFYSTHICALNRKTLKSTDKPNKTDAMEFLNKCMRKRQSHNTALVLEDRLTFDREKKKGTEPFRAWISYKEITNFQKHKKRLEYFVLMINAEISGQQYYEAYKCKTATDTTKILDFIKQAHADPQFVIQNLEHLGEISLEERQARVRSIAHFEFQTYNDSHEEHSSLNSSDRTSPNIIKEELPMAAVARPCSPSRTSSTSSPLHTDTFEWGKTTYIQYFPDRGPTVVEDGPIYMYMERKSLFDEYQNM